jgi:hypothetical protein
MNPKMIGNAFLTVIRTKNGALYGAGVFATEGEAKALALEALKNGVPDASFVVPVVFGAALPSEETQKPPFGIFWS